ncbi:AGAP002733-PA-like protein [Anopheles sinensis]|uniref:AGAP002733-PA-like protein n=1 Tax=Anopheles sinensis TaxID=74873 RepID=A0A084VSH5_ANOSI|nr:AGAP002733-PA-like protein [Anopheles sinensis]
MGQSTVSLRCRMPTIGGSLLVVGLLLIVLNVAEGLAVVETIESSEFPQHWEPSSAAELRSVLRAFSRNAAPKSNGNQLEGKQLPTFSAAPFGSANPCKCLSGICSCCLGVFSMNGCANLTYIPEDFAFEFRMIFNNRVLTKNRISGRNPKPICVHPPRFDFIEVCANFYDVYFVGRNMHVCLEMNGNFEGFELFNRSFNCLRIGDKGVKILKPGEQIGGSVNPSLEAEIDSGDDIEDYDEAVV